MKDICQNQSLYRMSNIVIVGATGDIGSAVHEVLESHNLITISNRKMPKFNSNHYFKDLTTPVTKDEVSSLVDGFDSIDALIYVPGIAQFEMIQDIKERDIDAQYNILFKNLVVFIQSLIDKLKKSSHGRIIVISSVWGQVGASCESIYASMKGAQNTLVKSLAKELASTSVTINAVAPGVVKGHMTNMLDREDREILLQDLPQNKLIEPREIANLILYILSEHSSSITGEVFNINGGWYT